MFMSYSEKLKRIDIKSQVITESLHECEICSRTGKNAWFNETDLAVHRKDMHREDILQQMNSCANRFCTICMNLFDSAEELQQHIRYRHLLSSPTAQRIERDIYICDACDHIFFSKHILEIHIMHFHLLNSYEKKKKTFVCPKCFRTRRMQILWHHLQHHHIPSLTACDICLHTFKSTEDLMNHLKDHPLQYKCDICDFHTTKDTIYESHLESHRKRQTNKKISPRLKSMWLAELKRKEKIFNNKKYNIHHVFKGVLLPPFMHVCIMCKEILDTKDEVLEHLNRDHTALVKQEVRPTYSCTCGANYHSRVLLKHHMFKSKGNHAEIEVEQKIELPELMDTEMAMIADNENLEVIPMYAKEVPVKDIPNSENTVQVIEMPAKSTKVTMVPNSKGQVIKIPVQDSQVKEVQLESEYEILGEDKDDGKQIVYVYAEDSGDELVTIDKNSEKEILGF